MQTVTMPESYFNVVQDLDTTQSCLIQVLLNGPLLSHVTHALAQVLKT